MPISARFLLPILLPFDMIKEKGGYFMWIVIIVFLAILVPVVFFHAKQANQSHKNFSNGIMNYNAGLSEFVYETDKSIDEIWHILNSHDVSSPLKYRFNEANCTIVFYPELPDGSADITYRISFIEHKGHNILKVTEETHLFSKNRLALFQNEFWYKTIGAIPYPYMQLPM